jgi:hypothetical protein
VAVLAEALDSTITLLAEALEPALPARDESAGEAPEIGDAVADALQHYLTATSPVQMELTVERQFGGADGTVARAMTQLGTAFRLFHAGQDAEGLAALRAARQVLAEEERRTADAGNAEA